MTAVLVVVHLLAATVWVGGSTALVFVGVPAIRTLEGEPRGRAMKELGLRWRPLGYGALLVAALTGVALAARDWESSAAFQIVFWVKVALAVCLVIVSYLHNFVLGPRLQAEIRDEREQATRPTLVVVGWLSYGADGDAADPRRRPAAAGLVDACANLAQAVQPVQRFVIGVRRSRPNAFGRSLTPGGAWRRLYSARSIIASARSTTSGSKPSCAELLARAVELDVRLEHLVELRVRRQRVLVALVGSQLGARRALDDRARDQLAARRARSAGGRAGTRPSCRRP